MYQYAQQEQLTIESWPRTQLILYDKCVYHVTLLFKSPLTSSILFQMTEHHKCLISEPPVPEEPLIESLVLNPHMTNIKQETVVRGRRVQWQMQSGS